MKNGNHRVISDFLFQIRKGNLNCGIVHAPRWNSPLGQAVLPVRVCTSSYICMHCLLFLLAITFKSWSFIYLLIILFIYLSIFLLIYLFVSLFVYFGYLFLYLFLSRPRYLYVRVHRLLFLWVIYLKVSFSHHLFIFLFVCLFIYLFIYLLIYLFKGFDLCFNFANYNILSENITYILIIEECCLIFF